MDYIQIINASKAYADRNDIEVSDNMDTFILMAEARINRGLKTANQTHRIFTKTVYGREFYTLPSDYNGMRSVHFNTGEVDAEGSQAKQLYYATPEQIVDLQENSPITDVYYYTILNDQLQLHSTLPGNGTIEMVFFRKVPNLNSENKTNWISINDPDIYLSGICAEIELFAKNYDSASLWDSRMTRAIGELEINDIRNRWAGNTLTIRNA